jgi:hypothetical protein
MRERGEKKVGGGSERHYRLEGGVTETEFSSLEGSQAVPASPSTASPSDFCVRVVSTGEGRWVPLCEQCLCSVNDNSNETKL